MVWLVSCLTDCLRWGTLWASQKLGLKKSKLQEIQNYEEEEFHFSQPPEPLKSKPPEVSPPAFLYDFKINLELYDPYYHVIEEKTRNMRDLFESQAHPQLTRTDKASVSIFQISTVKGNAMIVRYRLPCSYTFYSQLSKEGHKWSQSIDTWRFVETIHPNLTIQEITFKKFMLLQPRKIKYLKYQNKTASSHWEICISRQESERDCGLLILTRIAEDSAGLRLETYLHADLLANVKSKKVVQRAYKELADYFDTLHSYIEDHYSKEFV